MTSFTSSFGLSADVADQIRELGTTITPEVVERTRTCFQEGWDLSIPARGKRLHDLRYGDHLRQTLDLCRGDGTLLPILLFVPGGGFTGGDKRLYAHIPAFFARKGYLAAAMNYRLAPEFVWPSGSEDVASALDWLADNAPSLGGDPSRIFVVAQSAGAAHASGTLFDPRRRPRCHASIRAALLMSGIYLMREQQEPNGRVYFGDDPAAYADRSPVSHVAGSRVPIMLTIAELDPPVLIPSTAALFEALAERDGTPPPLAWLKGHNHFSPVLNLGGRSDLLGDAIHHAFQEQDADVD